MSRPDWTKQSASRVPRAGQGTNQGGLRDMNERVVLTLLRRGGDLARAEIARRTGLSAQTAARLIASLEADGLIRRGRPQKGRIGQPSVPMSLNPNGVITFGLKVGRRSAEMVAVDFIGTIRARRTCTYRYPEFDEVLHFALRALKELRAELSRDLAARAAGMGIAMPSSIWNWAEKIGVAPDRMADWRYRDLRAELSDRTDLPVYLQNDATAACCAELVFGRAPLPDNSLCFYIAFFVGGGLALDRTLYTGAHGNAAGYGPLRVISRAGEVHTLIDLASLVTLEAQLAARDIETHALWRDAEQWDYPEDVLSDWIAEAAHALAQAVHASQTILDLDAVIVDGWLPRERLDTLVRRIELELDTLDLTGMQRPHILPGTIGPDARALGAASLPLMRRFLTL